MDSGTNPFEQQAEPTIDVSSHLCVCPSCETERIRGRSELHCMYQLRSAVAAYLASAQTYGDLAALSYYYRLTTDWDHQNLSESP